MKPLDFFPRRLMSVYRVEYGARWELHVTHWWQWLGRSFLRDDRIVERYP